MEGLSATKQLNPKLTTDLISNNKPKPDKSNNRSSFSSNHSLSHPDEDFLQGNFEHLKRKTRKYDYQDRIKGADSFFNAEVATECETYYQGQRVRFREKKTVHFAFIVDLDLYEYQKVILHTFLNEVLQSSFFRFAVLILVLVNAILIGLQTDSGLLRSWSKWFNVMDQIILSIFVFEIVVKWVYDFRLFWKVVWNVLDFTIVFLVMLASVLPILGNSKALVVIRVVRAFRSLRSVSFLSSLQIVSHTIIKSGADMGNILLVLIIFMLVMSVMGVILFDLNEVSTDRFLSAFDAWYVLFICVTQDGWNQVLDEFRQPPVYFPLFAIYLIFAVSIGAFVFANLIVAVIVANLELSVKELREEQKLSENPLEFCGNISADELEIQPIYDLFSKNNLTILSQRPLRIPNFRSFSPRRLQAYISLIVALEQNMLEAEIIHLDMEKIMAVMLSIILQLDMYSQQKAAREEKAKTKAEIRAQLMKIDGTIIAPLPTKSVLSVPQAEAVPSEVSEATELSEIDLDLTAVDNMEHLAFLQQLKNQRSVESVIPESEDDEPFLQRNTSDI